MTFFVFDWFASALDSFGWTFLFRLSDVDKGLYEKLMPLADESFFLSRGYVAHSPSSPWACQEFQVLEDLHDAR